MRYFNENYNTLLSLFLIGVVGFSIVDLVDDFSSGESWFHVFIEASIVLFGMFALLWMWRMTSQLNKRSTLMRQRLGMVSASSLKWREKANASVQGLAAAIDLQFKEWKFSPSENDVALLLLKGLSMKDIAKIRETSERTVRQQAQDIYRKSALAGRTELAAFFLEDLMVPRVVGSTLDQIK